MRVLALQSGTSADGVDAALVEVAASGEPRRPDLDVRVLDVRTVAWEAEAQAAVLQAVEGVPLDPGAWCRLETAVGLGLADAGRAVVAERGAVDLVVSPGQTVFHGTRDGRTWGTLQVGQPAWLAEALATPVLFDLRVADVAAGGAGAPLIAAFDRLWLRDLAAQAGPGGVATLNLGGIANVQRVRPGGVEAFDTGPGNGLLDAVVRRATGRPYDADGALARAGRVDEALLAALLDHPYFRRPPTTTGRETFSVAVVDAALDRAHAAGRTVGLEDQCATLVELTARTVARGVAGLGAGLPGLLIGSGGGMRNPALVAALRAALDREAGPDAVRLESSAAHGIDPDAREAVMFAVLGYLSARRLPLDLPTRTAGRPRVAGHLAGWAFGGPAFAEALAAPVDDVARLTVSSGRGAAS
ncbi:anhydro-N-acetylmuramic acid kinase [Luteimicrobium sp. DT211]|uniref:anhydro-N-acetylmuramic acid kinase n=1 Tax=Luteimicrobium sp. DT211 TaxID=3393412 RepID=UPI003CF06DF7